MSGHNTSVAIVGISVRFPGARNVAEFWRNLRDGVESITFFTPAELVAAGVEPSLVANETYVRAGSAISDFDLFDARFFGMNARQAEITDPQQRIFLECAWEALEDAGYAGNDHDYLTGVYAGASLSHYLVDNLYSSLSSSSDIGGLPVLIGNDKDYLASQVSYKLNLKGPSISVQTACSTSLVAVHLACQSLLNGECDMALAGGVSLVPQRQKEGYLHVPGGHFSPDGHCRTFDSRANGTVFGNGAGVVVLKRLTDAEADHDHVYAVIKGSAVNNDGSAKVGFTAPGISGQANVIAQALAVADVEPEAITYIEAHGTGTSLGDPVEFAALAEVFRDCSNKPNSCALGSVKTNFGHLEAAAGLAGLVKTVLALKHRQIPPSLHFVTPNPQIDFAGTPFFVNTTLREWKGGTTSRSAGVSSFGIGGTNAHVVLIEASKQTFARGESERPRHVLTLSAKSETALRESASRFAKHLLTEPSAPLADVCFTANTGRAHFSHRLAVSGSSSQEVCDGLNALLSSTPLKTLVNGIVANGKRKVAFLFTGQGSQHVGMGRQLYLDSPTFRAALEDCDQIYRRESGESLLDLLYEHENGSRLDQTSHAQPVLFALEYALASLWQSWGVEPAAVMGHSLGEYVAACVAGVFSLEDGMSLVTHRAKLMQALPPEGQMIAVSCGEDRARQFIEPFGGEASIAAINAPDEVVISGATAALKEIRNVLTAAGVRAASLNVSHAFHSHLMEPMLDNLTALAGDIQSAAPRIPLVSNLTGRLLEKNVATDTHYWKRHTREPVRFAAGIETLQRLGCSVFLEIGSGRTLLALGRKCLGESSARWLSSIRKGRDDWEEMLRSLSALYVAGIAIDWRGFDGPYQRYRVPLPTYPFQRERYWVESRRRETGLQSDLQAEHSSQPLSGKRLSLAIPEVVFEYALGPASLPFLSDHTIHDVPVFPSTAYLEMVLLSASTVLGAETKLVEDFLIHQALSFSGPEPLRLQLTLTRKGPDKASFKVSRLVAEGDHDWRLHASGEILKAAANSPAPDRTDVLELAKQFNEQVAGELYYDLLRQRGFHYGPAFRGIERLWLRDGESLGSVIVSSRQKSVSSHESRPVMLDACLQVVGSLMRSLSEGEPDELYLPVGFERILVLDTFNTDKTRFWSHAVLRPGPRSGQTHLADVKVYTDEGDLAVEVKGLLLKRVAREAFISVKREPFDDCAYEVRWTNATAGNQEPKTDSEGQRNHEWLIFADSAGLSSSFINLLEEYSQTWSQVRPGDCFSRGKEKEWTISSANGEHYERLLAEVSGASSQPLREVVFFWGLRADPERELDPEYLNEELKFTCSSLLNLVKAMTKVTGPAPRLWLITKGAQATEHRDPVLNLAQAPLWGLARAIALEHPKLWGGIVDLEPGAAESNARLLFQTITTANGRDELAIRQGELYTPNLARSKPAAKSTERFAVRGDATYLITGGMGGLGLLVARWLHDRGARQLVLLGRSAPSDAAGATISDLEKAGTKVTVFQADVSQTDQVARVLMDIKTSLPELRGIVHAAGLLDDRLLVHQNWNNFARVFGPKVQGAWNLHTLTHDLSLDFFVLFSSVLSLLGALGQANYVAANAFLDSLAHYRRRHGKHAISINWGPWSEVGMAATRRGPDSHVSSESISPSQGLALLEKVMLRDAAQITILPANWLNAIARIPGATIPQMLQELARGVQTAARPVQTTAGREFLDRVRTAPSRKRSTIVSKYLQEQLIDLLRLNPATPPGVDQGFFDLGIDSLMAIDLRTRLESDLALPLPATLAFEYPSIQTLATYLVDQINLHDKDIATETNAVEAGEQEAAVLRKVVLLSDQDLESALLDKLARIEERL